MASAPMRCEVTAPESRERAALRRLVGAYCRAEHARTMNAIIKDALDVLAEPAPPEPREPEAEALMARVVVAYEAGEWSCVADTFYPRSREHDLANAIDAMRVYLTGKRESREGPMREERCGTSVAPAGWWCSRERGHDGPCAAHNEPLPTSKRVEREGPMREDR